MVLRLCSALLFVLCTLFSCTESSPALSSRYVCTVFDYGEAFEGAALQTADASGVRAHESGAVNATADFSDRLPTVRLTLFVKPSSDLARASSVSAEHVSSGLRWIITEPFCVTNRSGTWIGSSFLRAPFNEELPQGDYVITYTDTAMRTASLRAKVSFPNELCSLTFDSLKKSDVYASLKESYTALYDIGGALIYFDATKNIGESDEAILTKVPGAVTKRVFKTDGAGTFGVLTPPEFIGGF